MGTRKITREMINEMNRMVMEGISKAEIARKLGISICSVKTYASANPPEKESVNDAWQIPWKEEWDRVRKRILGE